MKIGTRNPLKETIPDCGSHLLFVQHIFSASPNLTTSFTMEAWVNYNGFNSTIVDKGNYDYLWWLNANCWRNVPSK